MTFFFHQVSNPNYLTQYPDLHHSHGLVTTILGLNLAVEGKHFREGEMKVRCAASVSPILWKGGRESVVQRGPLGDREAMLLGEFFFNFVGKTFSFTIKI